MTKPSHDDPTRREWKFVDDETARRGSDSIEYVCDAEQGDWIQVHTVDGYGGNLWMLGNTYCSGVGHVIEDLQELGFVVGIPDFLRHAAANRGDDELGAPRRTRPGELELSGVSIADAVVAELLLRQGYQVRLPGDDRPLEEEPRVDSKDATIEVSGPQYDTSWTIAYRRDELGPVVEISSLEFSGVGTPMWQRAQVGLDSVLAALEAHGYRIDSPADPVADNGPGTCSLKLPKEDDAFWPIADGPRHGWVHVETSEVDESFPIHVFAALLRRQGFGVRRRGEERPRPTRKPARDACPLPAETASESAGAGPAAAPTLRDTGSGPWTEPPGNLPASCDYARTLIWSYASSASTSYQEVQMINAHCRECEDCRRHWASVRDRAD